MIDERHKFGSKKEGRLFSGATYVSTSRPNLGLRAKTKQNFANNR